MTQNAIAYMSNVETKRHNLATEKETHRANKAAENWRNLTLNETVRSDQAQEAIKSMVNYINSEHFLRQDTENARHNQAVEWETQRNNVVNAGIAQQNADSNLINARANQAQVLVSQFNAETQRLAQQEVFRHNKSSEFLTSKQNEINQTNVTNQANRWNAQSAQGWALLSPQMSSYDSQTQLNYERAETEEWNRVINAVNAGFQGAKIISSEARQWFQTASPKLKIGGK